MSPFDTSAVTLAVGIAIGALSIAAVQWVRWWWRHQGQGDNRDGARDLAMQVVLLLDDLVGACHAAATDFLEVDVDEPLAFFFHTDDPVLSLPKDANWALLGRELSDGVRWLPNRLRNLTDALESIEIDPPNFKDLVERRQDGFARLGLRTMDLVEKMCAEFQLPLPERPEYYDPRGDFVSKIRELEEFWRRRAETAKQLPGGKSNVTPIFGRGIPENQLN
jgi:hypothetical protein